MGISVNGSDIPDSAIQAELAHHSGAPNPLKESVHEVVLRTLLLQEADSLGVTGADEDERIEALFAREVTVPEPDRASCERFYAANLERFAPSPIVEVRHILFQVTPNAPLELLRDTAQAVLDELLKAPERFDALARQ
jgi:peptidyl-prolyl cis-trans isomerase C